VTLRDPSTTPGPRRARVPGGAGARTSARRSRGAVTAETVVVLPLLVALAVALAWLVALATTQVRVVDSAREVARATARDEAPAAAIALGRRVAPAGARISVDPGDQLVTVHVVATVRGPGGLLAFLPGVDVESTAVAAREPG